MKAVEKLRHLIPHWIEHNQQHAAEFERWSAEAGPVGEDIRQAAEAMVGVNQRLESALEKLGGPLEGQRPGPFRDHEHHHGHEHNHHHHDHGHHNSRNAQKP
mgnify:CR=1 FL=1